MSDRPVGPARPDELPAGWRLHLDRRTRRPRPDLVIGGYPTSALRLTAAGAARLDDWVNGGPLPRTGGGARLARTLLDRGVAHPAPPDDAEVAVTVVVPVRDRAEGLATTIAAIGPHGPVVVVDDGSRDPGAVAAAAPTARIVRRSAPGGPAAARNQGWPLVGTDAVAFVDADVELGSADLARLARHLADPTVGAVAPRIVSAPGSRTPGWLAAYEAVRSPLDLGDRPAPVRPGSVVPYVPTTVLVVRRAALAALGGFDEALRTGEDVDLIWRLVRAGWQVRYDPSVTASHPARDGVTGWVRQRFGYGRSAAGLHRRHGAAVAPFAASPGAALPAAALLAGFPYVSAAAAALATGRLLARPRGVPRTALVRLSLLGQVHTARLAAEAVRRTWWPLAVVGALGQRRVRPALLAAAVVPPLAAWAARRPRLDPVRFSALFVADDLAYGAGVWGGVVRDRRPGALLPSLRPPGSKARLRPPGSEARLRPPGSRARPQSTGSRSDEVPEVHAPST